MSDLPSLLSPYILQTPWFSLHWYGFMYVVSYIVIYALARYRIKTEGFPLTKEQLLDILVWSIVGLVIGARLFYVIFYDASYYLSHPFEIILPIKNGTLAGIAGFSFHGGLIGVATSLYLYAKKRHINPWMIADLFFPIAPIGSFFGRIGNFINGELYGRPSDLPWAMRFPTDPDLLLRHPSQLYQALIEGLLLFVILWIFRKRIKGPKMVGLYLIGYGLARIFIECFRQPDPQIGYLFGWLTMGQLLSAGMILLGIGFFIRNAKQN